jgi:hypothetical protein
LFRATSSDSSRLSHYRSFIEGLPIYIFHFFGGVA